MSKRRGGNRTRNRSTGSAKAVPAALMARTGRSGTQPTMVPLTDVISALTNTTGGGHGVPLPVDPTQRDQFGPGNPLPVAHLDRPRADTGRPEPRVTEYPVNVNAQLSSDRPLDWKLLRKAARDVDIIRLCIEKRKGHLKGLRCGWAVSEDAIEELLQAASVPKSQRPAAKEDIEAELRARLQPDIARLTKWWRKPWSSGQLSLPQWIGLLMEEYLVLDAVVVYPEMTYGGDVLNFKIIDGTTIKPIRDIKGEIPQQPYPAYQQILYGFPRGEFTATLVETEQGTVIPGAYLPDQLYYYRDVVRTETPYGMSCVEQALVAARIWLNREGWLIAEYDEGTGPHTWLVPPENASAATGEAFTPQKRREWQRAYNDDTAGNTAARNRTQIAPPGFEPHQMSQVDQMYKPDYDMFLIRIIASHLGVTMPELNFTEPGGLGSSGYHEGQEDVQERVGTNPAIDIVQTIITELGRTYQGAPPELEFRIYGLDSEDEAAQDEVIQSKFQSARMTLNETRDAVGMPRYTFPEADMPMIVTQRGLIFLEGASQQAPPGDLLGPPQAPSNSDGPDDQDDQDDNEGQDDEDETPGPGSAPKAGAKPPLTATKGAEAAAYKNWARKIRNSRGQFELRHLSATEAAAHGIDLGRVTFKAAGDSRGPKEPAPDGGWPGWDLDLAAAAYWAPRITDALSGAVDAQQLAEEWIAHEPTLGLPAPAPAEDVEETAAAVDAQAAQDARLAAEARRLRALTAAAQAWIQREQAQISAALTEVLADVYTDGYAIGAASAVAVVESAPIATSTWVVGDTEAARLLVSDLGDGSGLRTLLNQSGVTINSVTQSRLDELGRALAAGTARGDSAEQLAASISGILTDPDRALMIATTELARAVSAASVQCYLKRGYDGTTWATAGDERVCPICDANRKAGVIRIGEPYPSGDLWPPGHPWCRCAPLPARISRAPQPEGESR